jgi:hypothetical protein
MVAARPLITLYPRLEASTDELAYVAAENGGERIPEG